MIDKDKLQEAMEADAAAEEAEGEADGEENTEAAEETEGNEDATDAESQEPEEETEATEEHEEAEESEEDEKAPAAPVPVPAFLKQKAKWKQKLAAAETRMKELESKYQTQGGLSQQDASAYQQYKGFIGKLQESAKKFPWLSEQLYALENGIEPDWRKVHSALDAHVKALPALDPTTQAMLAQQQKVLDSLQFNARKQEFSERKVQEDQRIRAMFKQEVDDHFMQTLNTVTAHLVKALPEGSFQVPDRLALAKELMALRRRERDALLKEQTKVTKAKAGAGTPALNGKTTATPKAKSKIPPMGTREYDEWFEKQVEEEMKA